MRASNQTAFGFQMYLCLNIYTKNDCDCYTLHSHSLYLGFYEIIYLHLLSYRNKLMRMNKFISIKNIKL